MRTSCGVHDQYLQVDALLQGCAANSTFLVLPIELRIQLPIELPMELPIDLLIELPIQVPMEFSIELPIALPIEFGCLVDVFWKSF